MISVLYEVMIVVKMCAKYMCSFYLLTITYLCLNCAHVWSLSHCNYIIDRIDSIVNFTNGSLFVSSGDYYWTLRRGERPEVDNAYNISNLLRDTNSIDAAVNIRVRSDTLRHVCVPTNEHIVFVSTDINNETKVNTYFDHKWSNESLTDLGILNGKSVNLSQPIDAFVFFDRMLAVFQGNSFTSVECVDGHWVERKHANTSQVFTNIEGPFDAAFISNDNTVLDDALLYLFQAKHYYVCPIYGKELCSGPHSIMRDFFKFGEECESSDEGRGRVARLFVIWMICALIIIFIMIIVAYLFVTRSRTITFWVNRHRTKQTNSHSTYEALNGQKLNETNSQPLIASDANSPDQSTVPFIDKDDHEEVKKV